MLRVMSVPYRFPPQTVRERTVCGVFSSLFLDKTGALCYHNSKENRKEVSPL